MHQSTQIRPNPYKKSKWTATNIRKIQYKQNKYSTSYINNISQQYYIKDNEYNNKYYYMSIITP